VPNLGLKRQGRFSRPFSFVLFPKKRANSVPPRFRRNSLISGRKPIFPSLEFTWISRNMYLNLTLDFQGILILNTVMGVCTEAHRFWAKWNLDLVFSNQLIETSLHKGESAENGAEIQRVGRYYFMQNTQIEHFPREKQHYVPSFSLKYNVQKYWSIYPWHINQDYESAFKNVEKSLQQKTII